jgi:acetyl esterase/lipase
MKSRVADFTQDRILPADQPKIVDRFALSDKPQVFLAGGVNKDVLCPIVCILPLSFPMIKKSFRRFCAAALVVAFLSTKIFAAETTPAVIDLWPEGVPGLRADASPEVMKDDRVFNVHVPTLVYYPAPAEKANGTAVIMCPGGGYVRLAITNEGLGAVKWLNPLGVSVFVLKYRMKEYGHPAPLRDVLRAVRLVRSRAVEFGIDPNRIGVAGSSAGGHLAACSGTLYDEPVGKTGNPLDAVSARPDFLILQYAVITMRTPVTHGGSRASLLGENPSADEISLLSVNEHVTKDTPPTFLVATQDDKSVPLENTLLFYQALRAAGVPAEMHLYPNGPHGFGFRTDLGQTSDWPKRGEEWMRSRGLLPVPSLK